jgi:hypothetical protein
MQARTTGAQRVLSQRVEGTATPNTESGMMYTLYGCVTKAEWVAVEAARVSGNPFEAVRHEHASRPVLARDSEDSLSPVIGVEGERYRGPRGRLLTFKKQV